jgi:hypothetical protein
LTQEQSKDIDDFIFDTYGLSEVDRETIRDTLATALPSTASKRKAAAPVSSEERDRFLSTLRGSLDNILSASGLITSVRERPDLHWQPWKVMEINISTDGAWSDAEAPVDSFLAEAESKGASLVVVRPDDATWVIGLLDRYMWWTPTRARLLATDLIAQRSIA